ncbi:MAG: acyl carrier protein [Prochloraceae cyanobacterium]
MNKELNIEKWLKTYLGNLIEVESDSINIERTFDSYGLDSLDAIELISSLEEHLEKDLDIKILDKYKTIKLLTVYLESIYKVPQAKEKKILD